MQQANDVMAMPKIQNKKNWSHTLLVRNICSCRMAPVRAGERHNPCQKCGLLEHPEQDGIGRKVCTLLGCAGVVYISKHSFHASQHRQQLCSLPKAMMIQD
jgi:hypothetical protein